MAKREVAKAKGKKGGPRLGSGRPGKPVEETRRNRVIVLVNDKELKDLRRKAIGEMMPTGTLAYWYLLQGLYGSMKVGYMRPAQEAK